MSSVNANHDHKSLFVITSEYQLLQYIKYLAMHGPVAILLVLICRCSRISLLKENGNYLTSEVSSILYWNVLVRKKTLYLRGLSSCEEPSSVVSPVPTSLNTSLRLRHMRTCRHGLREAALAVSLASGWVTSPSHPRD